MATDRVGFFVPEMDGYIADIRQKHVASLELAHQVNWLSHEIISRLRKSSETADVVRACYFVRTTQHYQAILILLERGFRSSAEAMCRVHLEAVYRLRALTDLGEEMLKYMNWQSIRQAQTVLKEIKKSRDTCNEGVEKRFGSEGANQVKAEVHKSFIGAWLESEDAKRLDAEIGEKLPELKDETDKRFKGRGEDTYGMRTLAEDAGMEDSYPVAYQMFSHAVHSQLSSLQDLLDDNADRPAGINYGPREDGLEMYAIAAIEHQLYAIYGTLDLTSDPLSIGVSANSLKANLERFSRATFRTKGQQQNEA